MYTLIFIINTLALFFSFEPIFVFVFYFFFFFSDKNFRNSKTFKKVLQGTRFPLFSSSLVATSYVFFWDELYLPIAKESELTYIVCAHVYAYIYVKYFFVVLCTNTFFTRHERFLCIYKKSNTSYTLTENWRFVFLKKLNSPFLHPEYDSSGL